MKLVIVESPAKSKTIGRYLGNDYVVEASVGHIRDLATTGKGGLGVDVDKNFEPNYVVSKDKKEVVKKIKSLAKKSEEVILATDPDREGEAIAWHLASVLDLDVKKTKRLEFHEITKDSITKAIESPRVINMDLVHSQEARRIIDRIIGFKLSTLLYKRIKSKSAGRVQSVALELIVDHEKEITDFVPVESWSITSSIFQKKNEIKLSFNSFNGKNVTISNEKECDNILKNIGEIAKVTNIKKTKKNLSTKAPFITSTMQQEAFNKYRFKTKETAFLAQKLYEGIETDEGLTGLITYIRTDSTRLSEGFIKDAKDYIIKNYGEEYYAGKQFDKKTSLTQDAHEAIRPTSIERTPKSVKSYLTDHEYKLYKLIYNRAVASLMSDKQIESTNVSFETSKTNDSVIFSTNGSVVLFKGYDVLKMDDEEKSELPVFEINETYELKDLKKEQHFSQPPARYNEGKLVKLMEEDGIGRPSTYASTIQTLIARKYITSGKEGLVPTEQGIKTSTVLKKYFPDMMNIKYTAEMENNLDKISEGETDELDVIKDFYEPFITHLEEVKPLFYKDPVVETGEFCPNCGSPLVEKIGRYGKFIACSNYPECKYIKKEEKIIEYVGENCPNCGKPLVYRTSRKGEKFIACSGFPKCKYSRGVNETVNVDEEKRYCPDCGKIMVKKVSRRGPFYACSGYPKCKHTESIEENKDQSGDK